MAEILVAAAPKHRRYHAGDIITIQEPGHVWGRMERPPDFFRLRVSGPRAPLAVYDVGANDGRPNFRVRSLRKRRFSIDLSRFTLEERDRLDAGETLEVSDDRFRGMIIDNIPTSRVFR